MAGVNRQKVCGRKEWNPFGRGLVDGERPVCVTSAGIRPNPEKDLDDELPPTAAISALRTATTTLTVTR